VVASGTGARRVILRNLLTGYPCRHRNGNGLDCRRANLVPYTTTVDIMETDAVHWDRKRRVWLAKAGRTREIIARTADREAALAALEAHQRRIRG
jgi:hypothetical protein